MKTAARIVGALGSSVVALSLAVAPIGVHASDGDTDFGHEIGQTTSLTPIQFVGGTGTFTYNTIVCAIVSSDGPEASTCSTSATGSYSNIICGTGSASGSETTTEADGSSSTESFSITFVSGTGVMTGGATGLFVVIPTGSGFPANCATSFDMDLTVTDS